MFGNIFEKRSEDRLVPSRGSEDIATKTPGLDGVDRARGAVVGKGPEVVSPLDPEVVPAGVVPEGFEELDPALPTLGEDAETFIRNLREKNEGIPVAKVEPTGPRTPEQVNAGESLSNIVRNIVEPVESQKESPEERKKRWPERAAKLFASKVLPFRPDEAIRGTNFKTFVQIMQEEGFVTEGDTHMSGFEESMVGIIKDLVRQKKTG